MQKYVDYLADYLKKIIDNPGFAMLFFFIKFWSLLCYPWYKISFKKCGYLIFIHPQSSVINRKKITIGTSTLIHRGVTVWPIELEIGEHVQINPGTVIYGKVKIGAYSLIGPNCNIIGGNHVFSDVNIPIRYQGNTEKGIIIGDDVWIGAGVSITDGVVVGNGSIIGAGSIVTRDVPPMSICVGNPAKIIRSRT